MLGKLSLAAVPLDQPIVVGAIGLIALVMLSVLGTITWTGRSGYAALAKLGAANSRAAAIDGSQRIARIVSSPRKSRRRPGSPSFATIVRTRCKGVNCPPAASRPAPPKAGTCGRIP